MATVHALTTVQIKQAVRIREQIEFLQAKLAALLGGTAPQAKRGRPAAKQTKPAAGHARTGEAPKGRWAHVRSPLDALMDAAPKQKGGPTAEEKAKPSAAMKARGVVKKRGAPVR